MGNAHLADPRVWRSPGLLLGLGLGGFADGILLHQLLQWHNMLSAVRPPSTLLTMQLNMRWDGLFHVLTWMLTLAGVLQLWRAGRHGAVPRSGRRFAGQLGESAGVALTGTPRLSRSSGRTHRFR